MTVEILVRPRQGGKTTDLLRWMRQAPDGEHRVAVCINEHEAMRLYRSTFDDDGNPTWAESWQFVSWDEALAPDAWRGVLRGRGGRVVLGIDNADLVLQRLARHEIGLATWSLPT